MRAKTLVFSIVVLALLVSSYAGSVNVSLAQDNNLTIWVSVDERYSDAIKGMISASGVNINLITICPDKFENEMLNAALNGSLPDGVISESTYIPVLVTMKAIKSLTDERDTKLYAPVQRTVAYYNVTKDEAIVDGKIEFYGIPIIANTVVLFVNNQRWDKPIETLKDLFNAALYSNDQTNPADKYYGFSFTNLPDPAMALFYGAGASIFKDGYVDVKHLQITDKPQLDALYSIYEMTKIRRLTPDWEEQGTTGTRNLFANEGRVALVIDDAGMLPVAKQGSVFGSELNNLRVLPVPGNGAPIRSIALMPSYTISQEKMTALKEFGEKLLSSEIQRSLFDDYQLLPTVKGVLKTSSSIEKAFDSTLINGYQLPINIKWRLVERVFKTELEKMIKGDQDQNRTALSIDVQLRPNLPLELPYKPIGPFTETVTEEKSGFLSFNGIFVVFIVTVVFVDLLIVKKRRS